MFDQGLLGAYVFGASDSDERLRIALLLILPIQLNHIPKFLFAWPHSLDAFDNEAGRAIVILHGLAKMQHSRRDLLVAIAACSIEKQLIYISGGNACCSDVFPQLCPAAAQEDALR